MEGTVAIELALDVRIIHDRLNAHIPIKIEQEHARNSKQSAQRVEDKLGVVHENILVSQLPLNLNVVTNTEVH